MSRAASRARGRSSGFTLVEVLAALMLVGIVLPVAMQGISLSLAAAGTAKRIAEAAQLAEAKLNELVVTGEWQSAGLRGDFGPDHGEYHWAAEVSDRSTGLSEVTVQVTWTGRGAQRSIAVSTLVYTPMGS